ncbi:MAG: response regulator, partial [Vallitaleaceae bacterium]|nr:response regulator [Vallitaleaceae bacterium]
MKRALLVNDSKFESLILKDMLQKMNFLVEIADEFDALYSMERFEPHVVIVNYVMQQTSGDKLIRLMKAGMPRVKCLLSSNSNIRLSDFRGGYVDGIVHTPVSKFLLESALESIGEYTTFEEEEEEE